MVDSDKEELRALYQVTVADLSYFKTQQWNVTYYALLIDGGLIGVGGLIKSLETLDRWVLATLSVLVAGAGLFVISKLQRSVDVRHTRLSETIGSFGEPFKKAWSSEYKHEDRLQAVYLLRGGIVLTTALTIWLVLSRL